MKVLLKRFFNSNMGYLPFKIIEGIFGIVSLSLYSYLLSPDAYGNYGIVNTTMMLTYLLSIGWFVFVAIRYVKEQKTETEKIIFFTNILTLQGMILFILFLMYTVFGFVLVRIIDYDPMLLFIYILFFIGYMMSQFYIHLLLYVDKRLTNVLLMLMVAVIRPTMVYLLFKQGVEVTYIIFIAHGLVDFIFGLIAFMTIKPYKYYKIKAISIQKFKEFFNYGFPLIGLTLTMYILNISDRYIIRFFYSDYEVGVYTPNYSIASATFLMISYGLSRGFYPRLLSAWEKKDKVNAGVILSNSIKNYVFLAVPAALGMTVLSSDIGRALISLEYKEGYSVMGYVAFGMLFLGLAEYTNKEWELTGNTRPIFANSILAAIVNLILNIIFVPMFGFVAAAVTTSISFAVYFGICFVNRKKELSYGLKSKDALFMLVGNVMMLLALLLAGNIPINGILGLVVKISIGMVVYFCIIIVGKVYTLDMLHHD